MGQLIGLAGLAGSGKDTAANYLAEQIGADRYAFANPIRDGLKAMFNLTDEDFERDNKEKDIPSINASPRVLMQKLGTEFGRSISENLWIDVAQKKLNEATNGLVISDVRFENEAEFIRKNGGQVWHIHRETPLDPVAEHPSELGIKPRNGDLLISNNKSIESLHALIDNIIKNEL